LSLTLHNTHTVTLRQNKKDQISPDAMFS